MLKFLGFGDLANINLGNTSCYYKSKDELLLIDVGVLNFERLVKSDICSKVKTVYIFITHNHPDHIGGLASTIFYLEYWQKIKGIKIIIPKNSNQKNNIREFLRLQGVSDREYSFISESTFKMDKIKKLQTSKIKHSTLESFAVTLYYENCKDVYVGDNNDIDFVKQSIATLGKNDRLYTDVTSIKIPVHLYFDELLKITPMHKRKNVVCCHFDSEKTIEKAEKLGFSTAINFIW